MLRRHVLCFCLAETEQGYYLESLGVMCAPWIQLGRLAAAFCLSILAGAHGRAAGGGPAVRLPTVSVQADPFVKWGMGLAARSSSSGTSAARKPEVLIVGGVLASSPADMANVRLLDHVYAIDGKPVSETLFDDIVQKFDLSAKGTVIALSVGNPLRPGDRREVKLTLVSERLWCPDGNYTRYSCWGLVVEFPDEKACARAKWECVNRVYKQVPRREHPRWAEKAKRGKLRNPDQMVPLNYVSRRIMRVENGKRDLFIIERDGGWIEVFEGAELPELDDVVGKMLRAGARLILHDAPGYELVDAPPASVSPSTLNGSGGTRTWTVAVVQPAPDIAIRTPGQQ